MILKGRLLRASALLAKTVDLPGSVHYAQNIGLFFGRGTGLFQENSLLFHKFCAIIVMASPGCEDA